MTRQNNPLFEAKLLRTYCDHHPLNLMVVCLGLKVVCPDSWRRSHCDSDITIAATVAFCFLEVQVYAAFKFVQGHIRVLQHHELLSRLALSLTLFVKEAIRVSRHKLSAAAIIS